MSKNYLLRKILRQSQEAEISFEEVEAFVEALLNNKIVETEKAFGGCHKCYGKGYATVRAGLRSYRTPPNTNVKTRIKYCTCDRGKQLSELVGGK